MWILDVQGDLRRIRLHVSLPCHSLFGKRQASMCLLAYADSDGTDQTARQRSLILAIALRMWNRPIL